METLADTPVYPTPDVADSVRDHATTHGWTTEHNIFQRRPGVVEHQMVFTSGPFAVVAYWNATLDGAPAGGDDFFLYQYTHLVERTTDLRQLCAWLSADRLHAAVQAVS